MLQDKNLFYVDPAEGFKNVVDGAGTDGFIGVAVLSSSAWDPFHWAGVTMGTIVVMNLIDPKNNNGTCPWELAPTPTPTATLTNTSTRTPNATATNTPTPTPTATATVTPSVCDVGSLTRYYWLKIGGVKVNDLTKIARFPNSPNRFDMPTSFEGPTNWADRYGARYVGYIVPKVTGNYTFWIASDDASELRLSTSSNASSSSLIAYVQDRTKADEWDKKPNQKSAPRCLVAGQIYYVEALHKQDKGGDHLSMAWQPPGGSRAVIDGQYLCPLPATASIAIDPDEIVPLTSTSLP